MRTQDCQIGLRIRLWKEKPISREEKGKGRENTEGYAVGWKFYLENKTIS